MKKIILILTVLGIVFGSMGYCAEEDDGEITGLLFELKIMNGDENGDFRLDDLVSRAEFTKLAIASSKYKNTVASGLRISPFKDVPSDLWSAPYIKAGVDCGLCKGYIDSTFRPDNTVSFEEAITMMLRVLGYSDDDFGISWPYGQVGLADNLDLTDGISLSVGDTMTRRDVARLVYNSLMTKMKDSQEKLLSVFDCQLVEDIVLMATNKEDISVPADKVVTSKGTYKITESYSYENNGRTGDAVIKKGEELLSFTPKRQSVREYAVSKVIGSDMLLDGEVLNLGDNFTIYYKSAAKTYSTVASLAEEGDTFKLFFNENGSKEYGLLIPARGSVVSDSLEKYVIYSKLDSAVIIYKNGMFEQIEIPDGTKAYKDKNQTTYSMIKNDLSMGDILYVKRTERGSIDYVSYDKGNIQGPFTMTGADSISRFNTNASTSIVRDGNKVNSSDIRAYDIAYYSQDLNMILVYSSKVTGVYENALPNKDNPTQITISGKDYIVEGANAFNKLSSNGDLNYGDTITVMLGRNNAVADVMTAENIETNGPVTGYLIGTATKSYLSGAVQSYSGYSAKLVLPDGNVREYIVSKDYKTYINNVVKITFNDGIGTINTVSKSGYSGGYFSYGDKKLGDNRISDDIKILDVYSTDNDAPTKYVKVFPQRIDGVNLTPSEILYMQFNSDGKISQLILKNKTGDVFEYGMMITARKSVSETSSVGYYHFDINGDSYNYQSVNQLFSVSSQTAVKMIRNDNGTVYMMSNIQPLEGIENVSYTEISTRSAKYKLSDKVVVYRKSSDFVYSVIPLSDILGSSQYKLTAYYDSTMSGGGRVRIIVAE